MKICTAYPLFVYIMHVCCCNVACICAIPIKPKHFWILLWSIVCTYFYWLKWNYAQLYLYFKCCVSRKKTYKNSFCECILFIATRFDFAFPESQNGMWFIGEFFAGSTMILLSKGIWEIFGRFIAKKTKKIFPKQILLLLTGHVLGLQ